MKRSRNVALVLLAGSLAGCDERPPAETVFQSIDECRQYYDEDICRTKLGEAGDLIETVRGFGYRLKSGQSRSA